MIFPLFIFATSSCLGEKGWWMAKDAMTTTESVTAAFVLGQHIEEENKLKANLKGKKHR